jgi:acetylornithine deacetylase
LPGTCYSEICRQIEQAVEQAAGSDSWLAENQPEVEFFGFRSDGHGVSVELPAADLKSSIFSLQFSIFYGKLTDV